MKRTDTGKLGRFAVLSAASLILVSRLALGAAAPEVQYNDNLRPAGHLAGGVLTLRLEIREAVWNPEGDNGPKIPIQAFAEEGQPPANPGPLIRIAAGTRVHLLAHNLLASQKVTIHGFHSHSGAAAALTVEPLGTREIEFRPDHPGVYFYWGTTTGSALDKRNGVDSQLSGAFVVDPLSANAAPDRIFVLGHWFREGNPKATPPRSDIDAWVINGKSWPHTGRLTYPAGGLVRWRRINATDENHPLHLHGHYFMVEGIGDRNHWTPLPVLRRRRVATEVLPSGSTLTLSWMPERPGNWLFHCHVLFHVAPELRQTPDAPGEHHEEHDATRHMAGLVLGITITQQKTAPAPNAAQPRRLRLVVGQRKGIDLHGVPGLGYQLAEVGDHGTTALGAFTAPGPPIVLTRGQPVEIAVENQLDQSTSVHWHGIELESYYDGVPGWGGEGRQITPPISPGETFVARFTPPRAGTFMYHTHLNDYIQLSTGLYGPLIVIEPGQRFDSESDKVFVLSRGGTDDDKDPFLINGSPSPAPIELHAGRIYRFRFIGITPAPNLHVTLDRDGRRQTWRMIEDGATLPETQAVRRSADINIYPGETYDFEFRPVSAGILRLAAEQSFFTLQVAVPIIVRKPSLGQ